MGYGGRDWAYHLLYYDRRLGATGDEHVAKAVAAFDNGRWQMACTCIATQWWDWGSWPFQLPIIVVRRQGDHARNGPMSCISYDWEFLLEHGAIWDGECDMWRVFADSMLQMDERGWRV